MIKIKNIKRWFWIHKWSSLICTIFLLNICLTGLPLIFRDEIDHWLNPTSYAALPTNTPMANLDSMVNIAKLRHPKEFCLSLYIDDDEPQVLVYMAPTMKPEDKLEHYLKFDSRTGKLLKDELPFSQQPETLIGLMYSLHTDLFLDLPGNIFLCVMGLLFVAAIVSGIILYAPFMKKLNFGTVRYGRSKRLKWLDLHNLFGIVIMAWMLVVGVTGVMNELSDPLFGLWQNTEVKTMLQSYEGKQSPQQNELHSLQAAYDTTKAALPGMVVTSIVFPGNKFGSPYHYLLWAKGDKPLTARLFNPVLVDARTSRLAAIVKMPWYLRSLEVSRPLHFGDYGGTPLKVLWALFDIATIVVLISGIYVWFARRKSRDEWLQKILEENNIQQTT
jgi:uncharacterized iron-regulated membrane protein